jgi:tRNA nucleotidyltransferase (CCA-adding enzyme)
MKIYLVGGAVRDKLLGLPVKEQDYVVVGATPNEMLDMGFRQVGKEFPVFLHPKTNEEYALARMERKVKPGYKGFTFDTSPRVTLEEDLVRRDLTINAMAIDPDTGSLIDPYHGKQDLDHKILKHVSPAFAEDPVRILRLGRFYARYAHLGFTVAPITIELMRDMVKAGEVDALVAERVWKELERALSEQNPEKFFEVLDECGALAKLFPGLDVKGTGMQALIAAAESSNSPAIRFSALLHDLPDPRKSIIALCNRYRVPNDYRELALLTAQHFQAALDFKTLSADEILNLLGTLDYFRREERFYKFLAAVKAIDASRRKKLFKSFKTVDASDEFDPRHLIEAAQVSKQESAKQIREFIAQGIEGRELAEKIRKTRLEIIENFFAGQGQNMHK